MAISVSHQLRLHCSRVTMFSRHRNAAKPLGTLPWLAIGFNPTPPLGWKAQQVRKLATAAEAIQTPEPISQADIPQDASAVLHRTLKTPPLQVVSAQDKHVTFSNGHQILDTTCGAGVACIGYNNKRVKQAIIDQIDKFSYCNSMFFGHPIGEQLATELVQGTGGAMSKAYIMSSGRFGSDPTRHNLALTIRYQVPKQWSPR